MTRCSSLFCGEIVGADEADYSTGWPYHPQCLQLDTVDEVVDEAA